MSNFFRRWLDELLTVCFLLLVVILVVLFPVDFATVGGRHFAQGVLWSVSVLVASLLIALRYTELVRPALRVVAEIGPIVVAVLGYTSLKLLRAAVITDWLGISSKDPWMMAADAALFGKTPYLWFAQWGLDSRLFLEVMSIFYGLYPWTPVIVLGWLMYKGDMEQLRLVRRSVLLSLYCGYLCYIFFPVSGPLSLETPLKPIFVQSSVIYTFLMGNFRFPTDCFPSLHTANPWLMVWICRNKVQGRLLAQGAVVCGLITMSTIALRFHYGVDDLAGLIWIFPVAVLARATLPRTTAR